MIGRDVGAVWLGNGMDLGSALVGGLTLTEATEVVGEGGADRGGAVGGGGPLDGAPKTTWAPCSEPRQC